jgi:hypothetical protein
LLQNGGVFIFVNIKIMLDTLDTQNCSKFPFHVRNEAPTYWFNTETLSTLKSNYKLDVQSPARGKTVLALFIAVRSHDTKGMNGQNLVNTLAFNCSFLTIKQRQSDVVYRIPLRHIEQCTSLDPNNGFVLNYDDIDFSQSEIYISDKSTIVDGESFEIGIKYIV